MEDIEEILNKANRCLNCKNPICKDGCPISTNIPEFIKCIKEENFLQAYTILQNNNIMSDICSNICPVEEQCMGKCIRGIKEKPVDINQLEKFINEWAEKNNIEDKINVNKDNNKKIAIIGAGPAGIACAVELRKKGYEVIIFEKENKIGGLLEYGIPDFRLAKSKVERIEKIIKEIGIKIKTNIEFGKDLNIEDLKIAGYDAIFLGIGAGIASLYSLNLDDCNNIYKSDDILKKYYNHEKLDSCKSLAVIGGGNVALDCARTAKKMGVKKVTVVYRRTKDLMPAIKSEVDEAINEGIEFIFNTKVIKGYVDKENKLEKIECIKTKIESNQVIDIEKSNFEILADGVVFAIGLKIDKKLIEQNHIEIENGLIKIDENNMTNIPGVFAGGDLTQKKATVCRAIASGKKTAIGIDNYLQLFTKKNKR